MRFNIPDTLTRLLSWGRGFARHAFIVGAQKCGTGSLHHYLTQHPAIAGTPGKELQYFHKDINYNKGKNWYLSHFPLWNRHRIALESTPAYLYVPVAAERIHHFDPSAKIIIVLRDPVARAFSAFNMYAQMYGEKHWLSRLATTSPEVRAFYESIARGEQQPDINAFLERELFIEDQGLTDREPALIRRGLYAAQVKRYIDLFGPEQVIVIFSKELSINSGAVVNRVFNFLELHQMEHLDLVQQHVREYSIDAEVRRQIEAVAGQRFAQDKEQLEQLLGVPVPW